MAKMTSEEELAEMEKLSASYVPEQKVRKALTSVGYVFLTVAGRPCGASRLKPKTDGRIRQSGSRLC